MLIWSHFDSFNSEAPVPVIWNLWAAVERGWVLESGRWEWFWWRDEMPCEWLTAEASEGAPDLPAVRALLGVTGCGVNATSPADPKLETGMKDLFTYPHRAGVQGDNQILGIKGLLLSCK